MARSRGRRCTSVRKPPKAPQMITSPATAKVFQGVASRQQMFRMFDRHAQRPNRWDGDAAPFYAGEWFEIGETEYDYMFEILPPLWVRGSMFAMREYMTGSVTSVFFALRIDAAIRYFHGYCDLSDKASVETMRVAIIERESRPVHDAARAARAYLEHDCRRLPRLCRRQVAAVRSRQAHRRAFWRQRGHFPEAARGTHRRESAVKLPVHLRHLPSPIAA
ncbi:hypothetical protein ACVMIX_005019 [Rhizobium leguminosarum]|uniref:DUF1419 domain-containing protein n=1 Tax=Rhizobium leguminosarum TaxID=384 RepID=A0A2Z4YTB5_RHILE|nr:hypothetical protein DLJ82_7407 [Rhizobium leguminosarum]